jgi:catechol 2,3-dioxygenase-like lactoylglutathione lyase family enzyme
LAITDRNRGTEASVVSLAVAGTPRSAAYEARPSRSVGGTPHARGEYGLKYARVEPPAVLEYTGIRVRDLARSVRFYTEGLGLRVGPTGRMSAGGVWQELKDPDTGAVLELNFYPGDPPYREGDELDHLGFRVDDVEATVRRLTSMGARLRIPPFSESGTHLAFLSDPDGVWLELYERLADEVPPTSRGGG